MKHMILAAMFLLTGMFLSVILPTQARADVPYQVPVDDESLKPYALFAIKDVVCSTKDNHVELKFTLPLALTGDPTTLTFDGPNGVTNPVAITGPNGTLNCTATGCATDDYMQLSIDMDKVQAYLKATAESGKELKGRTAVAKFFSGDPGGILFYDLKSCTP